VRVGAHTLKTVPPLFTRVAPTGAWERVAKSIRKPPSAGVPSFIPFALRASVSAPSVSSIQ
jgi:hypothetical protein